MQINSFPPFFFFFSKCFSETRYNNSLASKCHPDFWLDGKWRCCAQTEKMAAGCVVYDPTKNGKGLVKNILTQKIFIPIKNRGLNHFCTEHQKIC